MDELPPLPTEPRPGRYCHYQGNEYRVLGLAQHSETLEPLVVYQALCGERGLWVRPAAMFTEAAEVGGRRVARFAWVGGVIGLFTGRGMVWHTHSTSMIGREE